MKTAVKTPSWLGVDLIRHRWLFPLMGALTTLIGGSSYAFSVFIRPLEAEFGWSRPETVAAFSVAMFALGAFMWITGFFVDKYGPRIPFFIGASLMVLSQILSSRVDTVTELIITYGLIGGTGIGMTYCASTIATTTRWFPEPSKRGLTVGLSVAGFGMGSAFASPIWTAAIAVYGWRFTYTMTGVVFAIALGIIGSILRFPPNDWEFVQGKGWQPRKDVKAGASKTLPANKIDFSFAQAIVTPQIWVTCFMFFTSIFGGLMAVSQLAAFATDKPPAGVGLTAAVAALAITVQAIFNGLGRPIWGYISSKIGTRTAYLLAIFTMIVAMLTLANANSMPLLFLGAVLNGFAFGGTLGLNPILTTAFFGSSFIAAIYGFVFFLGFGFGGLFGPMAGAFIRDMTSTYQAAFYAAAGVALLSFIVAAIFVPKAGQEKLPVPSKQK
ncbi:MAG: MFS transporter [Peptococcaceae bacterium]|nr:MFS transporter [Peptococcaceae bacterium]